MPTAKFADPYEKLEPRQKLTTWVSSAARMQLLSIRPGRGTIQTTLNLLLQGLLNECTKRDITTYADCDRFIALVLERAAVVESPRNVRQEDNLGNVPGGTPLVHSPAKGKQAKRADAKSKRATGEGGEVRA